MSAPTRGRRNPPDVPPLALKPWNLVAGAVERALKHSEAAFDSLPAPHAETHHFGESDELIEFGGQFVVLEADTLLPNARVIVISGGLGSTDAGGLFTVIIAPNGVTDQMLRDSAARSVIGRSAATAGDPADIIASADGQVLQRAGGILVFAAAPVTADTVVTPAQLLANTNDLATSTGQVNRLDSNGNYDLTGFVAATNGTRRIWINLGTGAFTITLKHQSALSAAANRLLIEGAADLPLPPDFAALGIYDSATARWRVFPM